MPLHKPPQSLQVGAVKQVAKMVSYSLVAIEAKHERYEWSASLQKEVCDLQEFLLCKIRPLWDEVCEVLCGMYAEDNERYTLCLYVIHDFRILSTFMIHNRMRTLKIPQEVCRYFFERTCLSECQIRKLKNIESIDIQYNIELTDTKLEMIGSICYKLNEIHIELDSRLVQLESLNHLLRCRELQHVYIGLNEWEVEEYEPYVLKLLTDLPKLKAFKVEGIEDILPKLTSVSSIEVIHARIHNENQLKHIIKMCPNAQQFHLVNDSKTDAEIRRVQTCLAESTWQVNAICIYTFIFDQSMGHLLELKGRNLTTLELNEWKGSDLTLNYICVIGINCPQLKTLGIYERDEWWYEESTRRSPVVPETSVTTPPMFCHLEILYLSLKPPWNICLLLQIILHAKGLKCLTVDNVYFHGICDELAEILGVNPMTELEKLGFKAHVHLDLVSDISVGSIKHLIESCPKLNVLDLSVWLRKDTLRYVKNISKEVRQKNLNLEVTHRETPLDDVSWLDRIFESWLEDEDESD